MKMDRIMPALAASSTAALGPIVIAAGGTGGHFFPAEALAAALLARGHAIALFTDIRSGAAASTVFAGHPIHVLRGAGIAGRGPVEAIRAVAAIAAGTLQARALIAALRPAAIVGFGGYPTLAPALGSHLVPHRPPLILHEQNAVLGRANRALARRAAVLALSFPNTQRLPTHVRTALTGNPVRAAISAVAYTPPGDAGPIRLLILGGSLGARVLSEVVPAALAALPLPVRGRLLVTQQCRAEDLAAARAAYAHARIAATLAPFFGDVATLLADAHLVIARAGASSVAELAVVGRPAILVPLPGAIDDHQTANAVSLGAWVMPQASFTANALSQRLAALLNSQAALVSEAAQVAAQGRAGAAEALADLVEQEVSQARPGGSAPWTPARDRGPWTLSLGGAPPSDRVQGAEPPGLARSAPAP